MRSDRSEDFQQHFAVTHFFNPPRYLKIFEIVPGPNCKDEVVEFLNMFGEKFLGKTSVIAKDTPGFIGNRIGNFGIQDLFHNMKEFERFHKLYVIVQTKVTQPTSQSAVLLIFNLQ